MTTTSWLHRSRESLRALSGRTPLRVKMITALLALVAIALVVISAVGLTQFSGYLQGQSGGQVTDIYNSRIYKLNSSQGGIGGGPGLDSNDFGYYGPYLVELLNAQGQLVQGFGPTTFGGSSPPGPSVPTSASWLQANQGQLTTVAGQGGSASWQVIAKPITVTLTNDLTQQSAASQRVILVVGTSLANIDHTVAWLRRIDLLVSVVIMIALAVVGVAIVQTSLRPLTDIERTAEAIAAGDLSRRVPDRDPRTEVGRLGRSLNTMLARIESSFDAQSRSEAAARRSEERMRQFVADASHELRTPLTAMRGYAEYYRQRGGISEEPAAAAPEPGNAPALNGTPGRGSPGHSGGQLGRADLDRIMQRVEQESARMGVLVEDMLLLARLDQQRPLERRPVDLLTLAADAVQDARIIAPDRAIDLSVGSATAFLVLGDEVRLRQVIGNLMSNALNHTPDGTPVSVRILAGPRQPVPIGGAGGRRPGTGDERGAGRARLRAVLPGRPGADQEGGRDRAGPGHRGRAGRGARRHRDAGHRPRPGGDVPDHPAARARGPARRRRRGPPTRRTRTSPSPSRHSPR